MAFLLGILIAWALFALFTTPAHSQEADFSAQWTYGGEEDVAGFHLFWGTTTGTYALGYNMPVADYLAPPQSMTIPVALGAGPSLYSNEATYTVGDTTPPGPCADLLIKKRVPVE